MFGGFYYWVEKILKYKYSELLSFIQFAVFFVGVNLTFFPMHFLGVAGMPRRIPDYPDCFYEFNKIATIGSYMSTFSLIIFIIILWDIFMPKIIIEPIILIAHKYFIHFQKTIIITNDTVKKLFDFFFKISVNTDEKHIYFIIFNIRLTIKFIIEETQNQWWSNTLSHINMTKKINNQNITKN
jgi:hypothetical protein